jgi:uncharacterized protein YndB with AHSA1/START domain
MLSTTAAITVLKPIADVFAAVQTPSPYFVARASAPLTPGVDIVWTFPEMDTAVPVHVESVEPNRKIRFQWDGVGGKNTVEFTFAPLAESGQALAKRLGVPANPATTVTVTETGWPDTPDGRKASYGNTMGWTQMLCALKAHLEHGINLRRGAFLHHPF